jgi:Putative adhesin
MSTQDNLPAAPQQPAPARNNTLRTVLLVVGSIILAIILITTVVRVAYSLNREDTSGTFTVEDSFDEVEVRVSAADVVVEYADVDQARIKFEQGGTNLRLDRHVSGGVLTVTVDQPGWGWWNWGGDGWWGMGHDASLRLTLPEALEDEALALDIDSSAGDLRVFGDFGNVGVESTAGNVRMSGSTGNLEISTTAGNVDLNDLAVSGTFRSESTAGNGSFEFRTLPDRMDVQATAGDIRVVLPRGSYRIETDTTAGNVQQNVSSAQNADRVYRFETTAGNIEINER